MAMKHTRLAVVVLLVVGFAPVAAQDWPQWRGPARDGLIRAFREPASWPMTLTKRWNVEVGTGYATPLVVGDRLYVFTRQGENEVMTALDAASAKVLWRTSYPAPFKMNPATAPHGPGPKSTPTFAANRLFTLGISGIVTAFDADDRQTDLAETRRPCRAAVSHGHVAARRRQPDDPPRGRTRQRGVDLFRRGDRQGSLELEWRRPGVRFSAAVRSGGTPQVVTFTQKNFVGVSLEDGKLLWRRPFTTPSTTTSQTPILYKDTMIQMGRDNGITAFRVAPGSNEWTTTDVWRTEEVSAHMSDAVAIDNVLFGLSHLNSGQYFALDLDTGKVLWKSEPRQAAHAAIARAGNTIFSLEDDSELVVIRLNRENVRAHRPLQGGHQRHVDATGHLGQSDFREGCLVADALDDRLNY